MSVFFRAILARNLISSLVNEESTILCVQNRSANVRFAPQAGVRVILIADLSTVALPHLRHTFKHSRHGRLVPDPAFTRFYVCAI